MIRSIRIDDFTGGLNLDSNSFTPTKPGPLLTNYTIPESDGESSLSDPMGNKGAGEGARIIKLVIIIKTFSIIKFFNNIIFLIQFKTNNTNNYNRKYYE